MRTKLFLFIPPVLVAAAACGGSTAQLSTAGHHGTAGDKPQSVVVPAGSTGPSMCRTSGLSVKLGGSNGAAGSIYRPLIFTNTGTASCTLRGYPGVSFVAPKSGDQVGAAGSRNAQHAVTTVTLAAGGSASAVVQIVDEGNYPPSRCKASAVSGLRVYPPGNTDAAYVAFGSNSTACSTDVGGLTVMAVVGGTAGM